MLFHLGAKDRGISGLEAFIVSSPHQILSDRFCTYSARLFDLEYDMSKTVGIYSLSHLETIIVSVTITHARHCEPFLPELLSSFDVTSNNHYIGKGLTYTLYLGIHDHKN